MKAWPVVFIFAILWVGVRPLEARRIPLTPEQKTQLENAQTVLVEVLALTEKGGYEASPLVATVKTRLEDLGYTVTTDPSQPHDVEVKVKCEEQKTLKRASAEDLGDF